MIRRMSKLSEDPRIDPRLKAHRLREAYAARPGLPAELDDRAQDSAEPLLAIADHAAGDWPIRARLALVELHGGREIDDESSGVRLLADIRTVLGDRDRIASADLLAGLHGLDEAPWGDWYGRPLSARKLAEKLRPYGVHSRSVRFDDGTTPKGFLREQFETPWSRYLPSTPPLKRHSATNDAQSGIERDFKTPQDADVADCKSGANRLPERDVADVADREGQEAGQAEVDRVRAKFPEVDE